VPEDLPIQAQWSYGILCTSEVQNARRLEMSAQEELTGANTKESALKCLQSLKYHNINGYYFGNCNEAMEHLLSNIPAEATVGFGDSETVFQMGLPGALHDRGQKMVSPFWEDDPRVFVFPRTKRAGQATKDALLTDYFVAGINAITMDGRIVNVDGFGNRVAATIFGPRRVILIAGVNKMVANVEAAIQRIQTVAAPLNARRHKFEHGMEIDLPCADTGECIECGNCSAWSFTVIIERQMYPRIEVVLIGEHLGL